MAVPGRMRTAVNDSFTRESRHPKATATGAEPTPFCLPVRGRQLPSIPLGEPRRNSFAEVWRSVRERRRVVTAKFFIRRVGQHVNLMGRQVFEAVLSPRTCKHSFRDTKADIGQDFAASCLSGVTGANRLCTGTSWSSVVATSHKRAASTM